MEVIVLDDSSDGAGYVKKSADPSTSFDADGRSRPAKRRRQETLATRISETTNKVDLSEGTSHVSDTVNEPSATEAPILPASAAADDAESPTLSPQQVR